MPTATYRPTTVTYRPTTTTTTYRPTTTTATYRPTTTTTTYRPTTTTTYRPTTTTTTYRPTTTKATTTSYKPLTTTKATTTTKKPTIPDCQPAVSGHKPSRFKCKADGFFADKEDCGIFYRCVSYGDIATVLEGFSMYTYNCKPGHVFNEVKSRCVVSKDGKCPAGESKGDGAGGNGDDVQRPELGSGNGNRCLKEGFWREGRSCGRFYRCVRFGSMLKKFGFECGPGLAFDERSSVCTWPSEVPGCQQKRRGFHNGGWGKKSLARRTRGLQRSEKIRNGGRCERRKQKWPHGKDCVRYYECTTSDHDNLALRLKTCPEGYVFDGVADACIPKPLNYICDRMAKSFSDSNNDDDDRFIALPADRDTVLDWIVIS